MEKLKLGIDEKILWSGEPDGRPFLYFGDLFVYCLMWGVTTIILYVIYEFQNHLEATWIGHILLFVAFIVFLLVHLAFLTRRKRTKYYLTTSRVVMERWPFINSLPLNAIQSIKVIKHDNLLGSVIFKPSLLICLWYGRPYVRSLRMWRDDVPGISAAQYGPCAFSQINEVTRVAEEIEKVRGQISKCAV